MIYIENRKKAKKTLESLYPNAQIIDVTSKGEEPYVKLSPFYPHGDIPVPFSDGVYSFSVEGIWQGLKVFESEDIDKSKFEVKNMKNIKRTVRKFGRPLGHRKGVTGTELLDYLTARKLIYLYSYAWVLDNKAQHVILMLKEIALRNDLVLLDFDTNSNIDDTSKPLSHASLVKKYLDRKYPEINVDKSVPFSQRQEVNSKVKVSISRRKKNVKKKNDNKSDNQMSFNF